MGAHHTLTRIDLTKSPFKTIGTSALTGLIFEMAQSDDLATTGTNEQIQFCIGRTLKLRVITRLGLGLMLYPAALSGGRVVMNKLPIFILHPSTDTGEFELEFESIDGLRVQYLGKRQIVSSQVAMAGYNTPLMQAGDIWLCGKK